MVVKPIIKNFISIFRVSSLKKSFFVRFFKNVYNMDAILSFIGENKEIIYFILLSIFVGVEVIGNVPTVLHTPLMSGANAIHGVVIIGAIIVLLDTDLDNIPLLVFGFIAVVLGTLNVVGGFVVTDRMLEMFKKK
jgi:NAD(P) transhydrogenase subunit alpha